MRSTLTLVLYLSLVSSLLLACNGTSETNNGTVATSGNCQQELLSWLTKYKMKTYLIHSAISSFSLVTSSK